MKKFNQLLIVTLLLLAISFNLYSQESKVTLKVLDLYTHEPVNGAIISLSEACGSNCTEKTNNEGLVELSLSNTSIVAKIWAAGFYIQEVAFLGRSEITILLIPEIKPGFTDNSLVPYRDPVEESKLSTNLNSVKKKDISPAKITADEAFNNIAGLQVIQKSGMPGEGSYINFRGISSVVGNNAPLIVINGIPYFPDMNESPIITGYSKNILNNLNAREIENISILKGADAAVYGSLASNGVILIETDKATDLETKIEFTGQYGVEMNKSRLPLLNVSDYKAYVNKIAKTEYPDMADITGNFPFLVDDPDYYYKFLYNNNTNWQDIIYRPAFVTNNVLKVKGGDAIAKYNFTIGALSHGGQVKSTSFNRYNIRLNGDVNLYRNLSFFTDLALTTSFNNLMEQGMSNETNPLLAAMRKGPLFSPYEKDADNNESPNLAKIYNSDGSLIVNNSISNPLAIVNSVEAESNVTDLQLSGGLKFNINENLRLTGLIGLNYNFNRESIFIPGITDQTIMPLEDNLAKNTSRSGIGETFNMYYNLNALYARKINTLNDIKISAGIQAAQTKVEYDAGTGRNTASDFYKTLNYVTSSGRSFVGYNSLWNWMNVFANAQYTYNNLYALGLNLSADGSSATGPDATTLRLLPSVNAAWYGKNSASIRNINWLNKFTVRAEFTTTANSRFSSLLSKYYYTVKPYRVLTGIVLSGVPNTKLTSETYRTINAGFDVALANRRVNLSFDVYSGTVNDMILPKTVSSAYGNDYFYENCATISNTGFEASMSLDILQNRNYHWQIGGTIASNKNKVTDLGGLNELVTEFSDGSAIITQKNKSLYSFYGYQTQGIISSSSEATLAALKNYTGDLFQAGDVHFVDNSGTDNTINQYDRANLGDASPDFYGNLFTMARYKKIELSATFAYSVGNKAYNAVRRRLESVSDFGNQLVSTKRSWIYDGQITDIPRATYGDPMGNSRFSDRWIEDASYLKLKELMVSYKIQILDGLTVYAVGNNLFTITKYLGSDPEFMYSYNPQMLGFDYAKIALGRSVKIGFKLQF